MANANQYSDQPRYSRDVCDLMRRINALEARCSLAPANGFSEALDFDIMDGRIYALVRESYGAKFMIRVYDTTTLEQLHAFALPWSLQLSGSWNAEGFQEKNAVPRLCCGGGYIYMPGAYRHDGDQTAPNRINAVGAGVWRFDSNGGGVEWLAFPRTETRTFGVEDVVQRGWYLSHGGRQTENYYTETDDWLRASAWGEVQGSFKPQLHYVDGLIYGVSSATAGYLARRTLITQEAHTNTGRESRGLSPPWDFDSQRQQLCCFMGDFTDIGWSAARVTDYRGDDKERGFKEWDPKWPGYDEFRWDNYHIADVTHGAATNPWDHGESGFRVSEYRTAEYTSIRSHVHWLTSGASCVLDGRIYFDGGADEEATVGAALPAPQFGSVPADGAEIGDFRMLHVNRLTPFSIGGTDYSCAWLYATDGNYLFALEGHNPRVLNRYIWSTGAFVDAWELEPNQMRVVDGLLWLSLPAKYDTDTATPVQSKIEARDPATMDIVLEFYIGDPQGQTEWESFKRDNTAESLGTPDAGVSVPDLEALTDTETDAIVASEFIIRMRAALRVIAPFFLAPSGLRWHLAGTDDDENLYLAAMGDRTAYGATGGERLTWTRTRDQLTYTSHVTVGGAYIPGVTTVYRCILDHVATANTKPGVGAQWQTCWVEGFDAELVRVDQITGWGEDEFYTVDKTYDIDIGEIHECVTLLEGSSVGADPDS